MEEASRDAGEKAFVADVDLIRLYFSKRALLEIKLLTGALNASLKILTWQMNSLEIGTLILLVL